MRKSRRSMQPCLTSNLLFCKLISLQYTRTKKNKKTKQLLVCQTRKIKNIHTHASRYTFLLNPPPCWFTWILSNLQPRFGTAATADENYVVTTAIFSTTSKFAQRHFLDCKPALCSTEEGEKKKRQKKKGRSPRHWQLREILERSSKTPNLRYKIIVQFGGKR